MAKKPRSSKITSYRRYTWLNIGTILFGAIFVYMVITVILYLTAKHITAYEVTSGSISSNYRYSALALKTEEIQTAPYSGYVTYYARNGAKISNGAIVCSIDESPSAPSLSEDIELTDSDYASLKSIAKSFALNFSSNNFQQVYNLKADLDTYLLQVSTTTDSTDQIWLKNIVTTPQAGFVVYSIDGMENLTEADLHIDLFNTNHYSSDNLRLNEQVSFGDTIYKLVESEEWYLYFPITAELASTLANRSTMRFRFLKDNTTFTASFSIIQNDSTYFGKLSLNNSLVRYVTDRYLDIELLLDSAVGLKIPTSAIGEKYFYEIPSEFVTTNEDDETKVTLTIEHFRSDNSSTTETVSANIYSKTDSGYLLSPDLFTTGDYVISPTTSYRHRVGDEDLVKIQGVFNINKGYAVFREITILDENEEFVVAQPNNPYGLAAHDFIALDAQSVSDDEIVY